MTIAGPRAPGEHKLQARMKNPLAIFPEGMQTIQAMRALKEAAVSAGVAATTIELVALRASQINGCSYCVELHSRELRKQGETDERLFATAAWRDAPWFSAAERAALAFTEAATRLGDREDPVNDLVWAGVARHYDERALAALVMNVAAINFFNRLTVPLRQVAGAIPR